MPDGSDEIEVDRIGAGADGVAGARADGRDEVSGVALVVTGGEPAEGDPTNRAGYAAQLAQAEVRGGLNSGAVTCCARNAASPPASANTVRHRRGQEGNRQAPVAPLIWFRIFSSTAVTLWVVKTLATAICSAGDTCLRCAPVTSQQRQSL